MIVPRWEWRTFGDDLGDAERRLDALTPTKVEDSEEVYVLSRRTEASVKVRDGQLDVKRLERLTVDGLQQWLPVAKADLPVAATELRSLLEALHVTVPALSRETYDVEQLVGEIVDPHDDLRAVPVRKHRVHYLLDGCMVELTDVRSGPHSSRTIAVENADPDLVRTTVKALALWTRPNVSFPQGLKMLVGFASPRYAVVDVGTNSVKFVLGERQADGSWEHLVERAEVTRLGEGLGTGELQPGPQRRTIDAIEVMADEARAHGAGAIVAVGTAGLRSASNSEAFLEEVRDRCGLDVEVISGVEEARLAYLAATTSFAHVDGSHVVVETGGGSTQFTFGQGSRIDEQFSLDVGAVRLTEQFGLDRAVDADVVASALDAIADGFTRLDGRETPDALVGLGGALTNLAAVKHGLTTYDPRMVQGTELDRAELDALIERFRTRSADERRQIPGLQPKRAEVILAGACIARTVLAKLGAESVTVSDRGLRHGLLVERFEA